MKIHRVSLSFFAMTCLLCALLSGTANAQDPGVESIAGKGQINWITNIISASGFGVAPPSAVNAAQARALARRAAVVDARRNLLEVLGGVHIDSTTTVENFLVQSDVVRTKVEGVLQGSTVDGYVQQPDGSFEASVSIPLTGQLGDILAPMAMGISTPAAAPIPSSDVEQRLQRLEERVRELEQRLTTTQGVTLDQKQMLELFVQLVTAWNEYAGQQFRTIPTANTSSLDVRKLELELKRQSRTLKHLEAKLEKMNKRVAALETTPGTAKPKTTTPSSPYTGLVIKASGLRFRPCLRPSIYSGSKRLYPGEYIDVSVAASRGFVRYYRNLAQAQRGNKAGKLPYTAQAIGTGSKRRSLKLTSKDANILRSVLEAPGNFLSKCQVAIVF